MKNWLQRPHVPTVGVVLLAVVLLLVAYHCLFHLGRRR